MPFADLPDAFLQTILHQIALLLLTGADGDVDAARHAAAATLRAYGPQTEVELRLAARIVAFSLQAGEALAQAADPEMPLTRVLRLRTGAVSLSREAEKAERRLEKLREARLQGTTEEAELPSEAEAPMAALPVEAPAMEVRHIANTTALIEDNRKVAAYAKAHGVSWTEALRQRQRDRTVAKRREKEEARAKVA